MKGSEPVPAGGPGSPETAEMFSEVSLRPGQMVGQLRYRIHQLMGRGSMGEVYSADDTTLGQPVALKFLPPDRRGSSWRHRLAMEVAIAQRVSHPNVCRVHEIGGFEDRVFLSMELIRGETLEEVLARSFGGLSREEKLRIAHDLCAGLGAVHHRGIVHCDLKPSNVMLEHSGRAILTDFGLAAAAAFAGQSHSGTAEYMAPEQLEDGGATFRSDLFSLGMVLYEIFTGVRWHRPAAFELPSGQEVEPKVREALSRCLSRDVGNRPKSAEELADLLPERPEPDPAKGQWVVPPETLLVAPRYRPRPWKARVLFGVAVGALVLAPGLASRVQVASLEHLEHPPVVLRTKAREHLASLGYQEPAKDRLYGFSLRREARGASAGGNTGSTSEGTAEGELSPLEFWYRESPELLAPRKAGSLFHVYEDPPGTVAGTVGVHLDAEGNLRALDGVPDAGGSYGPWPEPPWSRLFAAAGLDPGRFSEVIPLWTPSVFADQRRAWLEEKSSAGPPLRVEAAAYHGRLMAFRMMRDVRVPGDPGGEGKRQEVLGERILARTISLGWFFTVLGAAVFLAFRNLHRGRSDRTAAFRLALFIFFARILAGLLGGEHVRGLAELGLLQAILERALHGAFLAWIIYVGLEPYARLWWPDLTASWVRLLYGRWRDPLVGRDLLVGTLFGIGAVVGSRLCSSVPGWLGNALPRLDRLGSLAWQVGFHDYLPQLEALRGLRQTFGISVFAVVHATLAAFVGVVGVVLLRRWLRHPWLSRAVALGLLTVVFFPRTGSLGFDLVAAVVAATVWLTMLVRFGFLTAVVGTAVAGLLVSVPLTSDPASWYASTSTVALFAVLALAGLGFFVSLEREKVLPPGLFNLSEEPVERSPEILLRK